MARRPAVPSAAEGGALTGPADASETCTSAGNTRADPSGFGQRDAFALTAAGGYAPFRSVAEGALRSVLGDHEVQADDELFDEPCATFGTLPIHDDGPPALEAVSDAGIPVSLRRPARRRATR